MLPGQDLVSAFCLLSHSRRFKPTRSMPVMFYLIVVLCAAWLIVRAFSSRAEARRMEEREQRMAQLLAEREALLGHPDPAEAQPAKAAATAEAPQSSRVCLGCRTVNEAVAATCRGCGLEL